MTADNVDKYTPAEQRLRLAWASGRGKSRTLRAPHAARRFLGSRQNSNTIQSYETRDEPILEVRQISKQVPGVLAPDQVDLELMPR